MIPRFLMALGLFAAAATSQDPHHAIPGLAQPGLHRNVRGLVLLGELGCASCHKPRSGMARLSTRAAPDLAGVGARLDPRYIAAFLSDPQGKKPGTLMPDVLSKYGGFELEKAAAALTQFLVSRSEQRFTATAPDLIAVRRGKELFHSIGCVACHAPRDDEGLEIALADSVPLGRLEAKYSVASLTAFLDDPLSVRPSGRMPHFGLTPRESADVANYLLERVRVPARLKYTLYLGAMHEGLDRLTGKAHSSGVVDDLHLGRWARYDTDFAVRFEGFLHVKTADKYTFELACDTGARLLIGGARYLSLDAGGRKSVAIELAAGRHAMTLTYLHVRGDRRFDLRWSSPGMTKGPVPPELFSATIARAPASQSLRLEDSQIARGETLFTQLGCVRCHEMAGVRSATAAAGMKNLDVATGCLSEGGEGPRYALSPDEVKDIRSALTDTAFEPTDEQTIRRDLVTFNCVACHQRGELGGVSKLRDDYFRSIGEDLGPSSRIPPPLTGVGAKLQPEWLAKTLAHGQSIRPAMKTRMPGFGAANTARLAVRFAASDTLPAVPFEPLPKNRKQAQAVQNVGQQLAGDKGMNCIACHQFAGRSSSTMISVDLIETTTQRLQKDWFFHYMVNPVRFRPGTIMPLFFPGGVSTRQDIAGGDTKQQLNGLWHYLARGRNVRAPSGLVRPSMEILVGDETVMLRRIVQNTGKRGISVGFPERVSYTFDAETIALNQIWWGRFIDPRGVWSGQGSGQVGILERERVVLPKGPAFVALKDSKTPWPTATRRDLGHQFRGYDLDTARRPVFRYECEGVTITDAPTAMRSKNGGLPTLRRKFTFESGRAVTLYFRAAVDEKIVRLGERSVGVGRFLDVHVTGGQLLVRDAKAGDKPSKEALVVVATVRGRGELVIDYSKREKQK